jgi:hypothetical protein
MYFTVCARFVILHLMKMVFNIRAETFTTAGGNLDP